MTPKEKAQELFDKYFEVTNNYYQAKECALIAVDEIIKAVNDPDDTFLSKDGVDYWEEVKEAL
jgi:hypothetical protein